MEPDDLPAPQLEVARDRIAPPAIASFVLPPPDGAFHRLRELRVRGRALFGTELAVRGYVTAIYDCAAARAPTYPKLGRVELLAEVDRDPRQCERPHFYLGEMRDTPPELSILVVDVPRKPAKPERDGLSRAELAAWPRVPVLAVGDALQVSGQWTTEALHGQRSTRGLLVYRASQRDPSPRTSVRAPSTLTPVVLGSAVRAKPPHRKAIAIATYNASVDALNACTRAVRAARYDDARGAVEQFALAIATNRTSPTAYVSLSELYRQWDSLVEARAIAQLGIRRRQMPEFRILVENLRVSDRHWL